MGLTKFFFPENYTPSKRYESGQNDNSHNSNSSRNDSVNDDLQKYRTNKSNDDDYNHQEKSNQQSSNNHQHKQPPKDIQGTETAEKKGINMEELKNSNYISTIGEQIKEERKMNDSFNKIARERGGEQDRKENESKPVFRSLRSEDIVETEYDNKSIEEINEEFHISTEKPEIENMNENMVTFLRERLEERQIKFYAFLNKEFNQLNYKSAHCSSHCFDNLGKSIPEVNDCLKICKSGINDCRQFATNLQKDAEKELEKCQNASAELFKNGAKGDPIISWISCYEKLLLGFNKMEELVKEEFSNFI